MWCDFALVAMAYLLVKHFLLDFGKLQPSWMFLNKGTYGHPGGITHALVHALGSLPIFLWGIGWGVFDPELLGWGIYSAELKILCVLFIGEFLIHYHTDWFKMWVSRKRGWSHYIRETTIFSVDPDPEGISHAYKPHLAIYSDAWFIMLGLDQLVHYLTYVAMVAIWLR
jgi:hypothetical protein